MTPSWRRVTSLAALALGAVLLAATLRRADIDGIRALARLLGPALLLALLPGAAWHLVRTEAWRQCFPADQRVPFPTIFRIRLAAEAFSYMTIGGVTGEPIKVVLLAPSVRPSVSAAAVALERAAYMIVTAAILGIAAAATVMTMPLSARWSTVYTWIAIVSIACAVVPALLVAGRGASRRPAQGVATLTPRGRIRGFLRESSAHFRALAIDRRRLGIVVALEAAAFAAMALEVFAALSLAGTAVTLPASIAIETFTRVASIATAFIPANLGALEVSNVAAAAALQAGTGAVALALLRRVRGLIWCAAGFLVYPRGFRRDGRDRAIDSEGPHDSARTLVAIQHGDSDALVTAQLGGMPVGERLARAAARAGYTRLLVWTPRQREHEWRSAARRVGTRLQLVAVSDPIHWRRQWTRIDPNAQMTVLGPGIVASPQLLAAARELTIGAGQSLAEVPAGAAHPASGVFRIAARDLASADPRAFRPMDPDRERPSGVDGASAGAALALRVITRDDLADAERALRASIYKATDGRLGRLNRRLSIPISIGLIRCARLSANAMSVFVIGLGLYAGWLFARGDYRSGVAAALISWTASVLDGCDGELARLQYKESAFGCWVDTLGDYVYYLAVFAGLTVGAVRQTGWPALWWCGAALGIGVLLTFVLLILLRWQITGGHPEHLRGRTNAHFYGSGKAWARLVAKLSTVATRATMPYGIVGFALLGLLPVVVVLSTIGAHVYWISLAREFRRLVNDHADVPSHGESASAA